MDPYIKLELLAAKLKNSLLNKEFDDDDISLQQYNLTNKSVTKLKPGEVYRARRSIQSMTQASDFVSRLCDPQEFRSIWRRFDPFLIRGDSMMRKEFAVRRFRHSVLRILKKQAKTRKQQNKNEIDPFHRFMSYRLEDLPYIPRRKVSAVYLSQVFKYAVKKTIVDRKLEQISGDPWDNYFYRTIQLQRPKRSQDQKEQPIIHFETEIKDDASEMLLPIADLSLKDFAASRPRSSSRKSTRSIANFAKITSEITKKSVFKREKLNSPHMATIASFATSTAKRATLPRIAPKTQSQREQFYSVKSPFCPDGSTSLTKHFYLPRLPVSERKVTRKNMKYNEETTFVE